MKLILLLAGLILSTISYAQPKRHHNLVFKELPKQWDEALPIGNGWLGALIWQRDAVIRLSLDRVDLWDDRPMPEIGRLTFKWVEQQVIKGKYDTVQKVGDRPYDQNAAPTKIPGAALEFNIPSGHTVELAELDLKNGLAYVEFSNELRLMNYIHASKQEGYFGWEGIKPGQLNALLPSLIPPRYIPGITEKPGPGSLAMLGYEKGTVTKGKNSIRYRQPTWNGHYYEVLVQWVITNKKQLLGAWTISIDKPAVLTKIDPARKEPTGWDTHERWWKDYWSRSAISIPDTLLETQYYRDMYKFGSVTRPGTPPISLQAIWTADDGRLPPWKGDYHHDLNTQLSYWPGYTSNHTDLTASFTSWLWKVRPENKRWTKQYFGTDGLNVPGVSTISGKPMGGWIQYAMSPTTVCWLSQHFYWQWQYTNDSVFLKQRAYPYIRDAALYLEQITRLENGKRRLPLSSSPEYNDNKITAWFRNWTNYDLSVARYLAYVAMMIANATGKETDEKRWIKLLAELPELSSNETGLTMAPGVNMEHSHRHMSPYIGIYPLKNLSAHPDDTRTDLSLKHLELLGTRKWTGYSFAWMANMYASANKGDSAAKHLRIFASNFVSPNSFHLNGDQKGGEYSDDKGRPFTLEGNFAFAQGIHEMLIRSNTGIIEIFPALPADWKNVSFHQLRTEGGYLVSAEKENGVETVVEISATKNGLLLLKKPRHFHTWIVEGIEHEQVGLQDNIFNIPVKKGQVIRIKNGFE
jgi:alpha-L-fucosidase 2